MKLCSRNPGHDLKPDDIFCQPDIPFLLCNKDNTGFIENVIGLREEHY